MTDNLTPEDRLKTMRAVKGKGTGLERRLSAMLAGMGLSGWRRNPKGVTGKPDVIFPIGRIAIFVDGCFWHGCPVCQRKLPQTNREYWERKITRNAALAKSLSKELGHQGWKVVRIWEHEMRNTSTVRAKIRRALRLGRSLA